MTNTSNSPRKKRKSSKPTYQAVLRDDGLETIVERVCDNMAEPITTFKTTQEVLKKTIKVQLTELKNTGEPHTSSDYNNTNTKRSTRNLGKSASVCLSHPDQHMSTQCARRIAGRCHVARLSCATLRNTKNPASEDHRRI